MCIYIPGVYIDIYYELVRCAPGMLISLLVMVHSLYVNAPL